MSSNVAISAVMIVLIVVIAIVVVSGSAFYLISRSSNEPCHRIVRILRQTAPRLLPVNLSKLLHPTAAQSTIPMSSLVNSSSKPSGQPLIGIYVSRDASHIAGFSSINYSVNLDALGNVPNNLTLSVSRTHGLTTQFSPDNVIMSETQPQSTLSISSSSNVAPGNYQLSLEATGGGSAFTQNETIQVVRYLVVTIAATFVPDNLTVIQGATVTWLRLNGAISQYDNGEHDVDFSSGVSIVSPTLDQYQSWAYTFTQPGNYQLLLQIPSVHDWRHSGFLLLNSRRMINRAVQRQDMLL